MGIKGLTRHRLVLFAVVDVSLLSVPIPGSTRPATASPKSHPSSRILREVGNYDRYGSVPDTGVPGRDPRGIVAEDVCVPGVAVPRSIASASQPAAAAKPPTQATVHGTTAVFNI